MSTETIRLYSIGHSNVKTERLIELLEQHGITAVCDVRSAPYSRYNPQFNRENLAESLRQAGLSYHYLGKQLGGMPDDPALRTEDGALPDDTKIMASARFQQGLDRLIALGRQQRTAFMCSEADYRGCHRHRLITPALLNRDIEVVHVMHDGSLQQAQVEPIQIRMF
jgi:uncharacterized protein (DUF488 family)